MLEEEKTYKLFLEEALEVYGMLSIADEVKLSPEFLEAHADLIEDEETWITLIRKQKHIHVDFFYKFSSDLPFRVQVILSRRAVSDLLREISK